LAIKNIGGASQAIVEERMKGGPFKSFEELASRVSHKDLNKKSIENLAKSGALDSLGVERRMILMNMEDIVKTVSAYRKSASSAQSSLFGESAAGFSIKLKDFAPASKTERLAWEKELLGLYVSDHPLRGFKHNGNGVVPLKSLKNGHDGQTLKVAGLITRITKIMTKNGQPMLFARIEDMSDNAEILVFHDAMAKKPRNVDRRRYRGNQGPFIKERRRFKTHMLRSKSNITKSPPRLSGQGIPSRTSCRRC
jgi:DNA polymerase-3 subunit alpha